MNQKAHVLGMTNTNFINAVGYDHPDHYTTARDVATMSRALMRDENYELFSENMLTRLSSVRAGTEREAQLLNTNNMITYYKGIEGLKTGTTDNAGFCLSAAATRGEMRLISVVLGCKDNYDRVDLSEKLLDRGFAEYELYYPKSPEAPEIPQNTEMPDNPESMPSRFPPLFVQNGMEREVAIAEILPSVIVIPKGRAKDIEYEIYLPEKVTAPIAKNQPLGTVTATLDGEVIYESYVTAASDVRKLTFFSMLLAMFRSFFGIAIN
ncbi:MAG: D-alanyl-D-alanine carboxypeptidase, partial [Oscillospiraceae bacterium]|nr:D-alanyl-D-alanine carboxypeptidase [Oscillospiraceae bacterium]